MRVKIDVPGADQLIKQVGIDKRGDVQRFLTNDINNRIGRYMPYLTGTTSEKLKYISSDTEITVAAPYAKYLYFGKVMVNAKTGKGPAYIPGVGLRYKRGTVLKVTDRPLGYTKTHNEKAGPYWDKALIAAEGKALEADLQDYIKRRSR